MSTGGGGRLVPPRFLLDAGQLVLDAIAKSCVVRLVGDDDVEPRDAGQPAEQVEVGGPQTPGIGRMIRDRDDDVIERQRRLQRDQPPPEDVLVPSPARDDAALVAEIGEREKARLVDQSLAAAIGAALDAQLMEQRSREAAHRTLAAPQLVVEVEHRGDEPGTQMKRAAAHARAPGGSPGGAGQQHLALGTRQQGRRLRAATREDAR